MKKRKTRRSINLKCLIAIIFLISTTGCVQKSKSISKINQHYKAQVLEPRDSLLILFTIKEWGKLNWHTFMDYSKMYNTTNDQVNYFVGDVFYSPDKKRIIVFIGEKLPNASTIVAYSTNKLNNKVCPDGGDTVINMSALIGFRNNSNAIWDLYPLNNLAVGCCDSESQATNILKQYYFEQMKEHSETVLKKNLDKNYGGEVRYDLEKKAIDIEAEDDSDPKILKNYGYNIQDNDFWSRSLLWQKGATKKGYYDFQLFGDDLLNPPKVNYPKSILKLF